MDERKYDEYQQKTRKYEIQWCEFKKNNDSVDNLCPILLAVHF